MTLNTSQVSYYMTQRKKGITQHISAMKAGISVRSGRRFEKGEWAKNSVRHWRTRKDPLEAVWDSMLVPLLKESMKNPGAVIAYYREGDRGVTSMEIGSRHFHRTVFKLPSLISFGQRRLYFPH